jgi:N-acetylmuramoyl-L-alanine amidase
VTTQSEEARLEIKATAGTGRARTIDSVNLRRGVSGAALGLLALAAGAIVLVALAGCGARSSIATVGGAARTHAAPARVAAPVTAATTASTSGRAASAGTGDASASTAAATTATTTPAPAAPLAAIEALRPPIQQWPIPYGARRKREMAEYSLRHYGEDTYLLRSPKVIVEHYTETATAQEAYNTFAPDVPDGEFHELPNTCAHFLVEPSGRIDELVPLTLRCRHTVGLNWTAFGIEHVGFSDQQILEDRAQIRASLELTRWLRCRFGIALRNVIGHNESLSSPYHRERVPAFKHQTHSDWNHADMTRYRALLARLACPR